MPAVTLIVPGDLDTPTGGYRYDRRVVAGLRARGWSVDVRTLPAGFPCPDAEGRVVAAAVLAAEPDGRLVLVDGLAGGVLADELRPHAARLRIVALVHHPLAEESGLDAATQARLRASERAALRHARRVLVTSRATAGLLAEYGVDAGRIDVASPGTDAAPVADGTGDPPALLCVATLSARKGHDTLMRALAPLVDLRWTLTCVGSLDLDPRSAGATRDLVTTLGLDDRVHLVGAVGEDALPAFYARADLFVLPTWFEGYGMAVAEAVARGLPVLATATGAIPEIVAGDAGVLLPPGDVAAWTTALRRFLADESWRGRLREGALRARQALPSWERTAVLVERCLHEASA